METEIYFLLHSLGIGAKYRGFRYLAYGYRFMHGRRRLSPSGQQNAVPKDRATFQVSSSASNETSAPLFPSAGPAETVICSFSLSVHPVLTKPTNSRIFDILSSYIKYYRAFPACRQEA